MVSVLFVGVALVGMQPADPAPCRVTVLVPPDARLSVNGVPCPLTGRRRSFESPPFAPGRRYTYTLRAEAARGGNTVVKTRRVELRAGGAIEEDFTGLFPPQDLPAPRPGRCRVTVVLPADARLFVDNVPCPLTSGRRSFETPPLPAGRRFFYMLRAEVSRGGAVRTRSQKVLVEAGKDVTVRFDESEFRAPGSP